MVVYEHGHGDDKTMMVSKTTGQLMMAQCEGCWRQMVVQSLLMFGEMMVLMIGNDGH